MSLFLNLILVLVAMAALVWGCHNPKIKKVSLKLPLYILGLVLEAVAIITWAYCDQWWWINVILIVEAGCLIVWVITSSKFGGTHNYSGTEPVILAILIACMSALSWVALAIWG